MTITRYTGKFAPWAGSVLTSLLLSGCDVSPTAPPAAVERGDGVSALTRCEPPELVSLAPAASRIVAPVAYPQQQVAYPPYQEVARLPRVGQFMPVQASETPLSARRPQAIVVGVRSLPETPGQAPLLIAPAGPSQPQDAGQSAEPAPESTDRYGRAIDALDLPALAGQSTPPETDPATDGGPALGSANQADTFAPDLSASAGVEPSPSDLPLEVQPEIAPRSPEMEAVASQAERHIRRGNELAGRGALYSARAEFIRAIRGISRALDLTEGVSRHSQALAAGLRALAEAEDFVPRGTRLEADLDLANLVGSHRTPALKQEADLKSLSPLVALQRYYTYAQEQLGEACGHEEAGSMALYGLGRVYAALANDEAAHVVAAIPKSMVFLQASLTSCPGNYLAANELAVCLAGYQRYEQARDLLQHCVTLAPQPVSWRNLAMVHRQLGEVRLAEQAEERSRAATRTAGRQPQQNSQAAMPVRWLDPSEFAATTRPADELQTPDAQQKSASAPRESKRGASAWAPWNISRSKTGSTRR